MEHEAPNSQIWALANSAGRLRCGQINARVNVAHPQQGVHDVHLGNVDLGGFVLGLRRTDGKSSSSAKLATLAREWPLPVAEVYVRGADLVASYKPSADWPYSPQIYWRANAFHSVRGALASISLLVSVQTDLLDTYPLIGAASDLPAAELLHTTWTRGKQVNWDGASPGDNIAPRGDVMCVLHRLAGAPLSLAEFLPSSDFQSLRITSNTNRGCDATWTLFADFLEKGVIRRARLYAAFLPRESDLEIAAKCCEAVEHIELPLTA